MPKARYIMVGGFLGAGKTTAIAMLAQHFAGQGSRVGLITNDQGRNLVDTKMLRSRGFATEEIPGGCFCCKFQSLLEASKSLESTARPEIFLAEPVGSCTDLMATVTYPLRRLYGEEFAIAPLSVLVDPVRAQHVLGLRTGKTFSDKVLYIYRKQLEEANLIIIAKRDLLSQAEQDELAQALQAQFPQAEVLAVSVRDQAGLTPWLERIQATEVEKAPSMDVDYELYAEGEARLGWLNATLDVTAQNETEPGEFLKALAGN